MVKLDARHQVELDALIRSQERDDRSRRVRRNGARTGIDLDRLTDPKSYDSIIPIEGRAWDWDALEHEVCPVCHGQPGDQPCLRCDGGAWGRPLRGRINPEVKGGPTTYAGVPNGLKGGVGR